MSRQRPLAYDFRMKTSATEAAGPSTPGLRSQAVRIGVVRFLNTAPFVEGLDSLEDCELVLGVPSRLIDLLESDRVDVALCSSIDYQRSPEPLVILRAGLLGCEGPTMTVRLYSAAPIESMTRVYADADSHTSVALLQILLREVYGIDPEIVEYDARERVASNRPIEWPEAVLLIGDKVVTDSPPAIGYPNQLDLGAAWRELTGLPFTFAMWIARASTDPAVVRMADMVLDRQRRYNRQRVSSMVHDQGLPRGWDADLAEVYLDELLSFEWTDDHVKGVELFFEKCAEHGLVDGVRPLRFANSR